jgi:CrcB protein
VIVAAVAVASALGAVARALVDRAVTGRVARLWPAGTLAVNLSGSLALGVVAGVGLGRGIDPDLRAVVGTGFIGAYTTFSAFAYEAVRLAGEGARPTAARYVLVSLVGGLAAAGLGIALGQHL